MLKVNHLSKSYHQHGHILNILNQIQFEIPTGRSFALVGPSGSGKSTLLSLLAGLDLPDEGEIFIKDTDITKLTESERTLFRSKNIGIIFQQFHLIKQFNALDNIQLPLELAGKKFSPEQVFSALEKVQMQDRAYHLPSQLSGGEQQRVAIARALIGQPQLLLADEPSGNLDEKTGQHIMEQLFQLVKESHTTLLLVTHDTHLAKQCDHTLQLSQGHIF